MLKKIILAATLVLTATTAFALDPIFTPWTNNLAIRGYDTVAYFTEGKPVKGIKKFKTKWMGAEWFFSSEEHMNMFKSDPTKYAPQYGGYCAYAMSDGRLVGIDEEAFTIRDGKLYLNYSKSVMKEWRSGSVQFIEEANGWYPKLVNLPAEN